jgi:hypothetical protein
MQWYGIPLLHQSANYIFIHTYTINNYNWKLKTDKKRELHVPTYCEQIHN